MYEWVKCLFILFLSGKLLVFCRCCVYIFKYIWLILSKFNGLKKRIYEIGIKNDVESIGK